MKRFLLLLLVCGCAAAKVKPSVLPPAWVGDESIWVDPNPGSAFGFGSDMESGAQALQKALIEAGMQPGTPQDPKTVVVKLDMFSGLIDFTFTYRLERGGRLVDEGSVVGGSLPCWHTFSSKMSKVECGMNNIADRILRSPALALEHQRSAPVAEEKPPPVTHVKLSGRLAVLDLRNLAKDMSADDARYFTDLVRSAVLKYAPQLDVMTRENLLVLLKSTGKDIANCEGECEVDTGRRIGADCIVSGEIQKVGTRYKISLRLHETREGRLVGASVASGKSIDELDDSANAAVATLFQ